MRSQRYLLYSILLLLLAPALAACTILRLTRPVVKIGLVGPFQGRYRYAGYDAINAARLALREANAAGGVGGYSVELVAYDDGGTTAGARTAAHNLGLDAQVVAVIGHFRDETTQAARALYAQMGLSLVKGGTVEGLADGAQDLLCLLPDYLGGGVQWIAEDDDVPVVCPGGAQVTTSTLELPPPSGVDAVLLTLDPIKAAETLLSLRQTGWEGGVGGGPALGSPLFAQVAGPAAAGVIFVSLYRWPDVEGGDAEFSAAYRAVGPHVPPPGPFALATYQATRTLLGAIEAAADRGEAPTRQILAQTLAQPTTGPAYVYRWTSSGTLDLIQEVALPTSSHAPSFRSFSRLPRIDRLLTRR